MAVVLDATVGGASSNTYTTLAEADSYIEGRLYNTAWDAATDDNKNRALVWATALLDQHFDWEGVIYSDTQALRFPRGFIEKPDGYYWDSNIIPDLLKDATVEMAYVLLQSDKWSQPGLLGLGLTKAKVGSLAVEISEDMATELFPQNIRVMLEPLGTMKSIAAVGSKTMNLKRR
jgi:hypothetical protein